MQTKNATGVIKTGSTAMRALAVGAFALGAGAIGAIAVGFACRSLIHQGRMTGNSSLIL